MKRCAECGKRLIGLSPLRKLCGWACATAWKTFAPKHADRMFWPKVDRSGGPEACWPYHRLDTLGYGRFAKHGPYAYAHRTVWQICKGPIPKDRDVLHRCDNRRCCNPRHLFLGTHQDNMLDMQRKERRRSNRLTAVQVREIRAMLPTWKFGTGKEVAHKYGVSEVVISKLKLGDTYRFFYDKECGDKQT